MSGGAEKCFIYSVRTKEKALLKEFISYLRELEPSLRYEPVSDDGMYFCFCLCYNGLDASKIAFLLEEFNRKLCKEGRKERLNSFASVKCGMVNGSILMEDILPAQERGAKLGVVDFIKEKAGLQIRSSSHLIITDPYMFAFRGEDWEFIEEVFKTVLEVAPFLRRIVFIVDKSKSKAECEDLVKNFLSRNGNGESIDVLILYGREGAEFHDRFWLFCGTEWSCKGFVIGTSLNGIGKKIALIDFLSEENVEEILEILREYYRDALPDC